MQATRSIPPLEARSENLYRNMILFSVIFWSLEIPRSRAYGQWWSILLPVVAAVLTLSLPSIGRLLHSQLGTVSRISPNELPREDAERLERIIRHFGVRNSALYWIDRPFRQVVTVVPDISQTFVGIPRSLRGQLDHPSVEGTLAIGLAMWPTHIRKLYLSHLILTVVTILSPLTSVVLTIRFSESPLSGVLGSGIYFVALMIMRSILFRTVTMLQAEHLATRGTRQAEELLGPVDWQALRKSSPIRSE